MAVALHLPGRTAYADAHALQKALLHARIQDEIPDVMLLLEHEETITLGRQRGARANVLDAGEVPVIDVERGGNVTWHGPGQLVAYPILKLEGPRADLHKHLHSLEDGVAALLRSQGLAPHRDDRNTGVWLTGSDGASRKVCSIGIACKQWVTWHGLALNVDVDLAASFARINPCGFDATVMTRLVDHLDPCPSVHALAPRLAEPLAGACEVELTELRTLDQLSPERVVASLVASSGSHA